MRRFKQEILDLMLSEPELYSAIAKLKSVQPGSLHMTIRRNSASINEYTVVKLVSDFLKKDMEDLVEETSDEPITEVQDVK